MIENSDAKWHKPLIFWGVLIVLAIIFIQIFKPILLPFALGFAVAYLLSPLVKKFTSKGMPSAIASLLLLGSFYLIILTIVGVATPFIIKEIEDFTQDLPRYQERSAQYLGDLYSWVQSIFGPIDKEQITQTLKERAGEGLEFSGLLLGGVASGLAAGKDFINTTIAVGVLAPMIAFFFMSEWEKINAWLRDLVPKSQKDEVMSLLQSMNAKISGFVRGQITVAVILAVIYAVALKIAGLKYAIIIGIVSGLLNIIPLFGSIFGLVVGTGTAWLQTGQWEFTLIIAAIFIAGQVLEGNFLTPKLIGDSVGLHPLWVFFALMAGGSLLGILGMLIAVPLTAIIGVLIGFGLKLYKDSDYYQGRDRAAGAESKPSKSKAAKKSS